MNHEERQKRIAEAAYYRSERRGFTGSSQLDDWLEAERELASLTSSDAEPQADDHPVPPQPDQSSGIAIPAPLAKEERIRAEEVKQSARELTEATEAQAKDKPAPDAAPTARKARKRAPGSTTELRRNV